MNTSLADRIEESRDSYRDEMNFAEFPLALLGAPSPGQKTLEFSDKVFDYSRDVWVIRKLIISASDRSSLPTPRDEEVFLGLINLSHQSGFQDRTVYFTKGQLVSLLGWSDDGRSYQRIDEALKKWASLTLYWENWWSKEDMAFIDRTFHILDNVESVNRDRYKARVANAGGNLQAGLSSFSWNSVIFSSFKSGFIKKLDLNFYKTLDTALSKKIYRFLDKRFYNERRIELNLQAFAFEHIGLSRNYSNSQIRRLLSPAITELVEKGFLSPISDDDRYLKAGRGQWRIVFIRKEKIRSKIVQEENPAFQKLVSRGITKSVATDLCQTYELVQIERNIQMWDETIANKKKKNLRNASGFLVSAIRDDFAKDLKTAPLHKHVNNFASPVKTIEPLESLPDPRIREFEKWWVTQSDTEKVEFEAEAVRNADRFSTTAYDNGLRNKGSLFKAIQQKILMDYYFNSHEGTKGNSPLKTNADQELDQQKKVFNRESSLESL